MASNDGPAWKIMKKHRVYLEDHLYPFAPDVLSQSDQDDIIQRREYARLRSEKDPVEQIRSLVDMVLDKGEQVCLRFMQEVLLPLRCKIPRLHEWVAQHEKELLGLGLVLSKDGDGVISGAARRKHLEKYKTYMKRETSFAQDYLPGEVIFIPERFVQPVLVPYQRRGESEKHEFLDRACEHDRMMQEATSDGMNFTQLFDPTECNGEPPRLVAAVGIAGIGKSTLSKLIVHRLVSDGELFERRFQIVVYIPFREMNDVREVSLAELFHKLNPSLGDMAQGIFENPEEVLFVMDGLDEFGRYLDFSKACNDHHKRTNLEALIAGLVTGKLLTGASILLTTRPIAMEKLDGVKIDRSVEITGFSLEERKSFFCKFYKDPVLGERAFQLLEKNTTLSDLCYNPSFCQMAAITIEDEIKNPDASEFVLTSVTDLFTRYLFVLVKHHADDSTNVKQTVASLARMALEGVQDNIQIFTHEHLQKFDVSGAEGSSTFINEVFRIDGIRRDVFYSFSHLTVQEYLAALAVYLQRPKRGFLAHVFELISPARYSVSCIIRAIEENKDGRYDLFQRFLYGLATDAPWKILSGLIDPPSADSQHRVKRWISLSATTCKLSGHRLVGLLHRLHELHEPAALSKATRSMAVIDLSYTRLSLLDCVALSWFLQFREEPVERLNLQSCGIGSEGLRRLQPALHRCTALRLRGNDLNDSIQLLADGMAGREGSLEILDLDCCSLTDKSGPSLRNILEANARLKNLRLSGNKMADSIQLLADGMAGRDGNLETLELDCCALTEKSSSSLSIILEANTRLKNLRLRGNDLNDSIQLLADGMSGREGSLETLHLDLCLLTDKSIPALHDIVSSNKALWKLGLCGNPFTEEGKEELRSRWAHRAQLAIHFNYL